MTKMKEKQFKTINGERFGQERAGSVGEVIKTRAGSVGEVIKTADSVYGFGAKVFVKE